MKDTKSLSSKIFYIVVYAIMIILLFVTIYPIWYSLINSLNSASDINKKGYALLWVRDFTWSSWKAVLNDSEILSAFWITTTRTVLVTIAQLIVTSMFAYGFSRPYLKHKSFFKTIGLISMYLNGGIIAYFIMFYYIGIYNTYWVYILPFMFGGFYYVIIYNANFKAIPEALFESAKLDGASEFTIYAKIVMPLSKPVLAALAIFTASGTWNDYTVTLYYTVGKSLQTLPYYTLSLIKSAALSEALAEVTSGANSSLGQMAQQESNYKTIELACMVLSALPLIIAYPFAQKYFESGIMLGSIKG
jgi:putative aldouronate transport system permease protein